jgi:hypothetical protein
LCVVLEAGWFSLLADDGGICARPMSLLATSGGCSRPTAKQLPAVASQRFPSRLTLTNAVARPVVWRSLASIVAARLFWSALP